MKRFLTFFVAASCLLCAAPTVSSAQDYEVPAVTVSKEKIRSGGKTYYSHVVQERQTLYSISKAYGVSLQDIYDSNPTLNLERDGLKKNQILLIPVSPSAASTPAHTVKAQPEPVEKKASVNESSRKEEENAARARLEEERKAEKARLEEERKAEKARQDELKAEKKAQEEARKAEEKARREEQRTIDKAKLEAQKAAERAAKARQDEEKMAAKAEEEARKAAEKAEKARIEEERKAAEASAGYTTYKVKWFDDLESIAKKFGVSKESIMNINGMKDEKLEKQQVIKIPTNPGEWEKTTPEKPAAKAETVADASRNQEAGKDEGSEAVEKADDSEAEPDITVTPGSHTVFIDLLLPFTQQQKADRTMTQDFYAGALLAARDLGKEGINLDLSVFDVTDGNIPVTRSKFDESTFVLGPIAGSGILKAAKASGGKAWIVSPLDPNCKAIADTVANVIQAPSSTESQIKDMVDWVNDDVIDGDKVILIVQKGSTNANTRLAVKEMKASGIRYSTIEFSATDGKSILEPLASAVIDGATNRIVLAYDLTNAAFASEVVRSLYTMVNRGKDVVLYATSKIRTFDEVETEHLHTVNLHSSLSYYVDYDARDVQEFLLEYRALYNTEPSRMAFQGYDLMKYFSILGDKYGKKWNAGINGEKRFKGLQSDILLEKTGRGGYSNTAVRRIVYYPNYLIKVAE